MSTLSRQYIFMFYVPLTTTDLLYLPRATSAKFGIQQFGPTFFDGQMPDLVVAGPNVGNNLGIVALLSGTVYVIFSDLLLRLFHL